MRVTTTAETADEAIPRDGSLVEVRGQRWVVSDSAPGSDGSTLLTLQSVEDGRYGESLPVIWEVEPGRRILPPGSLPEVTSAGFDPPERLAAFLDAVRWSAVTSADVKTLQAPLRSGVIVEEYQLEPVARAIEAPRVNLLLADDVGLGKTIEAGLVALELLLRHRAKRVMIVCPPGLMVKWQDEMAEKFGLDFTIVDSAQLNQLRRSHGSAANPFRVYPLTIVSLSWLRGAKAERLLHEVIEGDEAERRQAPVRPADPRRGAPRRARRAEAAVRGRLPADQADPLAGPALRAPAVPVRDAAQRLPGVVHRAAGDHRRPAVRPRRGPGPGGAARDRHPADEEPDHRRRRQPEVPQAGGARDHRHLPGKRARGARAARRVRRAAPQAADHQARPGVRRPGHAAAEEAAVLLARARSRTPSASTWRPSRRRPGRPATAHEDEVPEWMEGFFDDVAAYDDEELADAEDDATARSGKIQAELTDTSEQEISLLRRMEAWAARYENSPDAKAKELITYLRRSACPTAKHWTNERVVVFTEYRDTQIWLKDLLAQEGMAGEQVQLLFGGMERARREQLRLAFQEPPDQNPVRILLATDAASEGIDLHEHCHRLVNYDIPFNPNKLEQRIGRIDRYGQPRRPRSGTSSAPAGNQPATPTRPTWSSWRGSRSRSRGWRRTSARSTRSSPRRCSGACSARSPTSTSRTPPPPRSGRARAGGSPPTATCPSR